MNKKPTTKGIGSVEAKVELTIHAPQQRVWDALVHETTRWWPQSFWSSPKTRQFVIEPRLGGRVFEDYGNGEGFTWYQVIGLESPSTLHLIGHMGPPFGGPLATLLRLTLSAAGANATKLEITDAAFGQVADCDTESGWREVFGDHFRLYVEAAVPKPKLKPKPKPRKKKTGR